MFNENSALDYCLVKSCYFVLRAFFTGYPKPHTLEEFATRYKGVDGSLSARNTVLLVVSSRHAVNLTMNWVCWARDYGLSFLIWASDEEAQRYASWLRGFDGFLPLFNFSNPF